MISYKIKPLAVILGLSIGLIACDKGARPDSMADNASLKMKCLRGLDVVATNMNTMEKLDILRFSNVSEENFETLVLKNTLVGEGSTMVAASGTCPSDKIKDDGINYKDESLASDTQGDQDGVELAIAASSSFGGNSNQPIQVIKDCENLTAIVQGPFLEGVTGEVGAVIQAKITDADLDSLTLESTDELTQDTLNIKVSRLIRENKELKVQDRKKFEEKGEGILRLTVEREGDQSGKLDVVQVYSSSAESQTGLRLNLLSEEERNSLNSVAHSGTHSEEQGVLIPKCAPTVSSSRLELIDVDGLPQLRQSDEGASSVQTHQD